jgi:opacity protein-like surface antigen
VKRRILCVGALVGVIGCFLSVSTFAAPATRTWKSTSDYSNNNNPGFLLSHLGIYEKPWWYNPIVTLTGGAATARVGQTQLLTMSGDFTKYDYAANGGHSSRPLLGAFIGTELPVYDYKLDLGLAYYQPFVFSSGNGILTQGVDASSDDQYTYSYKVQSHQFLIEAKLLWDAQERYHPYLTAGAGIGFNRSYDYQNTVPPFLTFTPEFSSYTSTVFTYSLGAGIDVDVRRNWRFGLGYRFTDLGRTALGRGNLDTTSFDPVIAQSALYAQEIVAQFTYLMT